MLDPGDLIFHPRGGIGTISGMTRRDPLNPIHDGVSEGVSNLKQAYHGIELIDGGIRLCWCAAKNAPDCTSLPMVLTRSRFACTHRFRACLGFPETGG
jgi:hypothetical protein